MSKLELSPDNPFNGMEREDFLEMLEILGIRTEPGTGGIFYEDRPTPTLINDKQSERLSQILKKEK